MLPNLLMVQNLGKLDFLGAKVFNFCDILGINFFGGSPQKIREVVSQNFNIKKLLYKIQPVFDMQRGIEHAIASFLRVCLSSFN